MEGAGMTITAPEGYKPREFDVEEGDVAIDQEVGQNPGEPPTPPAQPAEEPPAPVEAAPAQPDFEGIFREKIGMTPDEVAKIVDEYNTLKKRKFIEDEELVATSPLEIDFLRTSKRQGNVKAFVDTVYADYKNMTDEEIIKHDILSADPTMPKALLERKYRAKLVELGWSEDLEPEDREFSEIRGYEANKLRAKHIENALKYKVPEKAKEPAVQTVDTAAQEQYQREFMESEAVKNLQFSKKVTFGDFEYVVDPSEVISLLSDPAKLALKFTNPDGSPNVPKMLKWYAAATDMDGLISTAVDAAIKKERLEAIKRDVNPAPAAAPPSNGAAPTIKWGVSKS